MLDKIREVIEMHDSLVEFKGGKEHCILPEHYDELSKDIVKKLTIPDVVKSFTAEQVGDMLANKFTTIEEAIHYFDTIE